MLPATSCLLTAAPLLPSAPCTEEEQSIVENQPLISTLPLSPVHNQADTNRHARAPSAIGNASTSYSTHLSSPAQTPDLGLESTSSLASACAKLGPKTREGSPSILVTVSVHGNDWEPPENVNECSASSGRSRCQGRRQDTSRPESRSCGVAGTPSVEMMTLTPSSSSLSTSTCDAGMSLSKSNRSSLRTLSEPCSSITLLVPTTAAQSAPSHLPRGCSMRLSKSSNSSLGTTTDGSNSPPFSDRLRVPSSCSRRQSAILPLPSPMKRNNSESRASSVEASWSTGCITPPFTRLGLNAPGVILPLTVRQYQRQQTLKKRQQEGKCSMRGPSPRTSSVEHQPMISPKKEGNLDDYTSPLFHLPSAVNTFRVTIEGREQVSEGREEMADTSEASCNQKENRPGSGDSDGRHTKADASIVPPQPLAPCDCTFEAGRICECPGYITATLVHQMDQIRPHTLGEEGQEAGTKHKVVKKKRTTRAILMKFVTKLGRGVNAEA